MASRIEIELTSQRGGSEWTWRAAGAKQPKGVLDGSILYSGAKVGDVCRAEADFEIDGITIKQVYMPQGKRAEPDNKIAFLGPQREHKPVSTQLVARRERPGKGQRTAGHRGDFEHRDATKRGDHKSRGERRERSAHSGRDDRNTKSERSTRPPRSQASSRPAVRSFKRLNPKDDNRRAVLDQLPAEQRPIAEQVLRGGIPAVRQAIDAENAKAKEQGRPELNAAALIAVAEGLMPQLKAADWMDRALATKAGVNEISVRDLRAVVTGADAVARTEEARLLAAELREALDRRTQEDREMWTREIKTCLDENRVVRALRLSSRPPDAQTKFPPDLLERLKNEAEEAMSPDAAPDRWITLLDAVSNSPVRRSVEPKGLPSDASDELLTAAKAAAGRIPALARQMGVTMPPPPVRRPIRPPRPPKSAPRRVPEDKSASGASADVAVTGEPPVTGGEATTDAGEVVTNDAPTTGDAVVSAENDGA